MGEVYFNKAHQQSRRVASIPRGKIKNNFNTITTTKSNQVSDPLMMTRERETQTHKEATITSKSTGGVGGGVPHVLLCIAYVFVQGVVAHKHTSEQVHMCLCGSEVLP